MINSKNLKKNNDIILTKNQVKNNKNKNKKFSSNDIILIKDPLKLKNNEEFPKFEYEGGDGFKCVKVTLKNNQSIRADAGAMNYMSDDIKIETKTGSIFNSILRPLSGSSMFYNIFYNSNKNNTKKNGIVNFSGVNPGNVGCFYIPRGKSFNFVSDSYICSTVNLDVNTNIRFGGLILGYGLTFVNVKAINNDELVWCSSFGDVIEIILNPAESIKIDNGVLLGFDADIAINTKLIGGFTTTLFSGEGLVSNITNKNNFAITVYLQSRSRIAYNDYISNISKKNRR